MSELERGEKLKRVTSSIIVALLFLSLFAVAFNIQPAKASGTIYINADGSIDPPTAPITTFDYVTYTFAGSIYDSVVVLRSNIIVDGNGHALQGSGSGNGFSVSSPKYNVTIKNMEIRGFEWGILLYSSSFNTISGNRITNNNWGIYLSESSRYNSIFGNNITANSGDGIQLYWDSNYNTISGNRITNNNYGISVLNSQQTSINENSITNNNYGIWIYQSIWNPIYHNNFVSNTQQALSYEQNFWDNGYPSGGNYWSDYTTRYPNASEIDGSCIWNTPYVIDAYSQDNYPLMGSWTINGEDVTVTPSSDVALTFANVESEGITTVNRTHLGPSPPAGCKIEGYFDIQTTATYSGSITIRIVYNDTSMTPWEEGTLRLLRWNEVRLQWEDITTYVDTVGNVIYGETNHLSMFGITAGPVPGDINRDGVVDISDAAQIGLWWQKAVPPAPANVDITGDGFIDISDAALIGINWQKHT